VRQLNQGSVGAYRYFQKKVAEVRFAIFLRTGLDLSRSDIVGLLFVIALILSRSFIGFHHVQSGKYGLGPDRDCTNRICIKPLPH
jgi:hypothetical protein